MRQNGLFKKGVFVFHPGSSFRFRIVQTPPAAILFPAE
jgi:hypothetical protein